MSITFDKLTIRISELQTANVTCAPWETPVLVAMYGENVQKVDTEEVDREYPDARDEFARLAVRYGPKNADTPTVAAVYGNFGPGVKALQDEINRAKLGVEVAEVSEDASLLQKAAFDLGLQTPEAINEQLIERAAATSEGVELLSLEEQITKLEGGSAQGLV